MRAEPLSFDEQMMMECIRLARKGQGRVSPNPLVGAVLVKRGRIVSRGYHHYFGGPHAEVDCLSRYKGDPSSTTLYVNLEPCSYHGKTPPCTELIRARNIPRVVVGVMDPNPRISGLGVRKLRRYGIDVVTGVLQKETRHLNRHFFLHITKGRPYIHVKIAQSLDGRISRTYGQRTTISSPEAVQMVHRWRHEHDAVLVGAGTIRTDNPRLNVRLARGRDPHVVVLDSALSVSPEARVFSSARSRKVIVVTSRKAVREHARTAKALRSKGVLVREFTAASHQLNLRQVLRTLYSEEGIGSVLVEGGSRVFTGFMNSGLVDELSVLVSPVIFGKGPSAFLETHSGQRPLRWKIKDVEIRNVGRDVLLKAYVAR